MTMTAKSDLLSSALHRTSGALVALNNRVIVFVTKPLALLSRIRIRSSLLFITKHDLSLRMTLVQMKRISCKSTQLTQAHLCFSFNNSSLRDLWARVHL